MDIGQLCQVPVETADPDDNVKVAAQRMRAHNTGALIVVDDHKVPVGIVTDRDLSIRVLSEEREPRETCVRDIMTPSPFTLTEDQSVEDALDVMREHGIRRLPVVGPTAQLIGVVALDDILTVITRDLSKVEELLRWAKPMRPALSL